MATFTDRLRILIDYDGKSADTGLKGLAKSVREAEGAGGKLKAGWASTTASIKANAGAMAAGAGAALLAFGLKSADAFSQTAKAAIDLGAATGLSTEEASRWIAVADDFEVSADQLQAGIGKITKSLDSPKWAEYGIATRDAAGNARDANAILLDTFDMLGRVTNESERARIGQELFGRGFANLSPIIGRTRGEYEQMLGAVEDGQVITAEEAKKAEKWRLAMDKLSDTFGELSLSVGETVTEMAPMLYTMSQLVKIANELALTKPPGFVETGGDATEYLKLWYIEGVKAGDAMQYLTDKGLSAALAAEVVAKYGADAAESAQDLGDKSANAALPIGDMAGALDTAAQRAADLKTAWDDLKGSLSDEAAWLDLQDQFDGVQDAAEEAYIAAASGSEDAAAKARDHQQELVDLKLAVGDYASEVLGLPPEQVTDIVADMDDMSLVEVEALLNRLTKTRNVKVVAVGDVGYMKNARGTPPGGSPGGLTLVGEEGPELVMMPKGAHVTPAGETSRLLNGGGGTPVGGGGGPIVVQLVLDGRAIQEITVAQDALRRGVR